MSTNTVKKLSNGEKLKWVILVVCMAILYFIPEGDVYTAAVKGFCLVTVAGIYLVAFEMMPAYIAATLIPVGYWIFEGCSGGRGLWFLDTAVSVDYFRCVYGCAYYAEDWREQTAGLQSDAFGEG